MPPLQRDAAARVVPGRPAQVHLPQARLAVRDEAVEDQVPAGPSQKQAVAALEALLDRRQDRLQAGARGDRAGRHRRAAARRQRRRRVGHASGSDEGSVHGERGARADPGAAAAGAGVAGGRRGGVRARAGCLCLGVLRGVELG